MFQVTGEEDIDYGALCIYILVMLAIVIGLYIFLFVYTHFLKKGSRQHYCTYCGKLVDVESRCCHAPVEEYIFKKICSKCKKETTVMCKKCKKIIMD
jgi:hypothetical protein